MLIFITTTNCDSVEKAILEVATFLGAGSSVQESLDRFIKVYETHVKLSAKTYRTFGDGKYRTKTLNTDYKPHIVHHLSTGDNEARAIRDEKLLKLCQDSVGGSIFRRYLEKT